MASGSSGLEKLANPGWAIRRYGNRCLRKHCRPVVPGSVETANLVQTLWRVLDAGTGVGLAAPQIGQDSRVVVVKVGKDGAAPRRLTLINPEIVEFFGPTVAFEEGCLSFPGLYAEVLRSQGMVCNYTDEGGHTHQIRDQELLSRVIQHEVDHLDGILFVDRLKLSRRWMLIPRLLLQLSGHLFWKMRTRQ